jgi:hypothetical protein
MYKYKDRFPKFSVFQYTTGMAVKKTTYRVLMGGNLKKETDHLEDLAQKLEDNIKIYLKRRDLGQNHLAQIFGSEEGFCEHGSIKCGKCLD